MSRPRFPVPEPGTAVFAASPNGARRAHLPTAPNPVVSVAPASLALSTGSIASPRVRHPLSSLASATTRSPGSTRGHAGRHRPGPTTSADGLREPGAPPTSVRSAPIRSHRGSERVGWAVRVASGEAFCPGCLGMKGRPSGFARGDRCGRRAREPQGQRQVGAGPDSADHPCGRGRLGGRPPTFDREAYRQRDTVERCVTKIKRWCGPATRYDKTATIYLARLRIAALSIRSARWLQPACLNPSLAEVDRPGASHCLVQFNQGCNLGDGCRSVGQSQRGVRDAVAGVDRQLTLAVEGVKRWGSIVEPRGTVLLGPCSRGVDTIHMHQ